MPFTYNTVLLVGATSGIVAGMADKLIAERSKVIAVGRRQDRLDSFIKKHSSRNAASIRFDITDPNADDTTIVTTEHPDLNCFFMNAGGQSQKRLSRPAEIDLTKFHEEINVNFTSNVNLAIKFLPHLQAKSRPTSLINTRTYLVIIPAVTLAAYAASKATLTVFVDCLRERNRHKPTRITQVYPPVAQSDHAGTRGRKYGLPLDEFTERARKKLLKRDELIIIESIAIEPRETYMDILGRRRKIFTKLSKAMLEHFEL